MSASTTSERNRSQLRQAPPGRPPVRRVLIPALLLLMLLIAGVLGAPVLRWAYAIERAGQLIDAGMAWPTPRRFDSLPAERDRAALEQALTYLDIAAQRRPTHPHAYRLIGQVYAAEGDWLRSAEAYERALAWAPDNPQIRYEASLVYARADQVSHTAAALDLTDRFAAGRLSAPGVLIKSLFCSDRGAESCYMGRTSFRMPFAASPRGPLIAAPTIFLHSPASLSIDLTLPAEPAALRFVAGLDPAVREWASDGALLRVWVTPARGARVRAAELAIDRAAARRGWVPGWADLSPWAGQAVQLTLETDAGPAGDGTDDWYGWGDLALTSPAAAHYAALLPGLRAAELRQGLR